MTLWCSSLCNPGTSVYSFWCYALSPCRMDSFFCNGPVEDCRQDLFMIHYFGLDGGLRDSLIIDGVKFYVYGDSVYLNHVRPSLLCGFHEHLPRHLWVHSTPQTTNRTSVKWIYKEAKQMFRSTDFKHSLFVRKSPVLLPYLVSCLLWNVKVCFYGGGQVGSYFEYILPSIQDYMSRF